MCDGEETIVGAADVLEALVVEEDFLEDEDCDGLEGVSGVGEVEMVEGGVEADGGYAGYEANEGYVGYGDPVSKQM